MNLRHLTILLSCSAILASSCKNGGLFGKKKEKSDVTGWSYNDKNMGGYQVSKEKEQKTGPGLVFVQGGTFTMGATEEDVMRNHDNIPRRITVSSFYMDKTEVANVHYREYLYWLETVFDDPQYEAVIASAKPDTLVWRSELANNEPLVEYYLRHPSYNYYPVVGVTWKQAHDFCLWRSDRVNEKLLIDKGFINKNSVKNLSGKGQDNFNTKAYLVGEFQAQPGKTATSKKNPLRNANGSPRTTVNMADGILMPGYRLPTEAEWEYAAYGYVNQNPQPRLKEKKRGEELISNKQVYAWSNNYNGMRDNRRGSWQGAMLANFKRGSGDNMGVAGGLNDRASITAPVNSFYPNGFGLYNMSGNVSEWVADVYRPLTPLDGDDFNYFRGNKFQRVDMSTGKAERDSIGRIKMVDEPDSAVANRRNYQRGNVINYLDGDSLSMASYGYGKTTLIGDKSRVIKGGSWNDMPYWLSPGNRRFLEEDQSSSTIGFRCAMDRMGSQEGNGRRTGNFFKSKRQRR